MQSFSFVKISFFGYTIDYSVWKIDSQILIEMRWRVLLTPRLTSDHISMPRFEVFLIIAWKHEDGFILLVCWHKKKVQKCLFLNLTITGLTTIESTVKIVTLWSFTLPKQWSKLNTNAHSDDANLPMQSRYHLGTMEINFIKTKKCKPHICKKLCTTHRYWENKQKTYWLKVTD